jgi:hypothetical protein
MNSSLDLDCQVAQPEAAVPTSSTLMAQGTSSRSPDGRLELPRLAFVGDVPLEQTAAGPLITYRLLADYDATRLHVINGNSTPHDEKKRLPGVGWQSIQYFPNRLYRTRLNQWLGPLLANWVLLHAEKIATELKRWRAEAVLTIPHLYLWLAAATAARRLELPLHLILHDDWPSVTPAPSFAKFIYHRKFRRFYRGAASRLCVSAEMADHYQRQYGVGGTVLYPTRGSESATPRVRVRQRSSGEPFVVAYAGSLWGGGYISMLQTAAMSLQEWGGRLDIYNDANQEQLRSAGLTAPNVRACGFPPLVKAAEQMGATADVMLLPLSFLPQERAVTQINFPSKLADYTAIGLPILIWSPPEHAVVRWAKEHGGAAELVTDLDQAALRSALARLAADEELRLSLAAKGVAAGNQCFALEQGRTVLYEALLAAAPGGQQSW